ncbi:enterochelin esterase family protein [Nocardioides sp. BE266]|uniref:alpha/beta hydrolase n=1 Tax=Nocardioides sp. BE266 TaxID=2817725 RepID=UPI0028655035|nr:alpha/beta hydrolase-fold protein [Nocardioides sp. BE266]MDR7254353.1 enterochelin esterase family protein [Nocardioides sp. BE266]
MGRTTLLDLDDRRVWLHVPEAEAPDGWACVVFQDGAGFLDPDDDLRAGIVLGDLVASGSIRPTVGVFVDAAEDRNGEYDAFDATYADLLADRVLPLVGEHVHLAEDPSQRTLCGFSSGGNASLTAAWHRPDSFGAVVGFSSSFPQVCGGNPFPRLLATEARRPIRVFLHVGRRDLGWDEPEDNWVAENLRTAAALHEAGYDVRLELGDGGHDSHDAGVLLPDALRWALRD